MLSPASCWHLNISPDTTFLPHDKRYRFPHFLAYFEALILAIDTLQTPGDNTLLLTHQYTVMEALLEQRPELEAMISPRDRFFMGFYMKQLARSEKLKVLRLRKQIME
ncbi:hypothetical protein L873DRAFT_1814045 [Choiromyces venosus 120613-1]|uniref:Uncharacterized protein n=1 Tax=Choiromyces venosus 120613-1 TaxID=1336337 RepID=A0A3N4J8C4_9PEZI|nr:hypothetical protein L873DRAFT_1814045 [Choiromyces venosus 120613-1]